MELYTVKTLSFVTELGVMRDQKSKTLITYLKKDKFFKKQ